MTADRFHCIGIPVKADETRSAAVCRDGEGRERVVLVARGYALIVDPGTGACRQLVFRDGEREYPYAAMSGGDGLFYTAAGSLLAVIDPFRETFVHRLSPAPGEECAGFAFAEDAAGFVYATTYPGAKLLRLHPGTGECRVLGRLDAEQKYAMSLAIGADGWAYAGIGTTKAGIAAFRLSDGAVETIRGSAAAVRGSGHVHAGEDGDVYGSLPAEDGEFGSGAESSGVRWFRLRGGKAEPVDEAEVSPSVYRGAGYRKLHRDLSGGRSIVGYELADEQLVVAEPDGTRTAWRLAYEGGGTALSPLAAGPDGGVYGTSNHPLHLYRYEPPTGSLRNFGGRIVERGGGGNICAYAAQGPYLVGVAYPGGTVHVLDTRRPIGGEPGAERNPRLVYADDRIHRPRAAVPHPDGEHVLYGGFPGYGAVGGALGVLHVPSRTVTVYGHERIVPHQSTLALAVLSGGDVIGGTSIETPGGAEPLAGEAALYRFDWAGRRVAERWTPIPGAREISLLAADGNDRVYGLTSDSTLFAFDPDSGRVLHRQDLSAWGKVVRHGLLSTVIGGKPVVLGLLSRTLFAIDPHTFTVSLVAELPKEATSGIAVLGGSVYYGCGSELWRYQWEEGQSK
ncbi:PQQ-binding-like beta-propeller repeat protein [Paenibacillus flagellatus]|uniref:Uncharacterized protein n=1 Tax=Paenibacillus flagellatus TaxID=2211139 RepID=A0A2V5KE26_9BACL|nr:PQQ-binding-like beta-propeller repeat protein [Paenibacillus flagellatus]PYI56554.1 hypothetical protein DLM86_06185 [Paenibacillus flagellatus]